MKNLKKKHFKNFNKIKYSGYFKNGRKDGKGTVEMDGEVYEGEFENGHVKDKEE